MAIAGNMDVLSKNTKIGGAAKFATTLLQAHNAAERWKLLVEFLGEFARIHLIMEKRK